MHIGIKIALLFTLISTNMCLADHEDLVHLSAHVGLCYLSTTVGHGILKITLPNTPPLARALVAGTASLIAGAFYDFSEPNKGTSLPRNALGVGLAVGSIMVFKL